MIKKVCSLFTVAIVMSFAAGTQADLGNFSTLTYNVAGLPDIFSSAESDRQTATEQISCYVNEFDIVHVQEDFNYHAALYDTCNNHPFRSPTTGGMGIGSGLNTMSRFSYEDWVRVSWDACNGVDCLTPKGFTMARVRLAEGIFIDVYNLHTQAQTEDADLVARRSNISQLAEYIDTHSKGNAVIIFGDTNTRFTRSGDNIREFINRGFSDPWVDLIRLGSIPGSGDYALVCDPKITSADCEIVDKVLYRDNGYLNLSAYYYAVREDAKTSAGLELSDHPPVETLWTYNTDSHWKFSDKIGGPHGIAFNDYAVLPETPELNKISLRAGRRIDQVSVTLDNGMQMTHGGNGGSAGELTLGANEYLTSATFCSAKHNNRTRIFYARFLTNLNRELSGGTQTDSCQTYTADSGWNIVGFHGRSESELDKIGVIFSKR